MPTETLEQRFVDALTNSISEVFESMIMMPPNSIETVEPQPLIHAEVIGSLGFTGTKSGAVVLAGSRDLVVKFCANMLMMEPSEIEDEAEISDSFGEVTNMVTGNFKNAWVDAGNVMDLSIPTVVFGHQLGLTSGKDAVTAFAANVNFDDGTMRVELRMHD